MSKKVLVTEKIADEGVQALQRRGYEVDVMLKQTPEQLLEIIEPYDALIVRSATKVDSQLLDAAKNLKIVGRAGVTVDNIDVDYANSHGVIVCNAPTSNIVSAAEHTMALLLAAARNITQANESVHSGEWTRHKFMGTELYGKTIAIFGLGRVGSLVAERAHAFDMNVIAYDPYCSPERAAQLDVTLSNDMDEVISKADVITVHLPLTSDTQGMFSAKEFAEMKDGVILINAARPGIYDEKALADFVAAGKVRACALDVFENEPCKSSPLHEFENAVLTPHISAVTHEAQVRAGEQIAEYVWAGLEGSIVPTAVSSTSLPAEVMDKVRPYVPACRMMGRMATEILGGMPKKLTVVLEGSLAEADTDLLATGVLDGILDYKDLGERDLSNAETTASRHGITLKTSASESAEEYASAVRIIADEVEIASTLYGLEQLPRIISLMGYKIDIAPAKQSLVFEYEDAPGRVGVIGTILGEAGVNITTMQIGNKPAEKCALIYMNVEGDVTNETIQKLRDSIDLKSIWKINL